VKVVIVVAAAAAAAAFIAGMGHAAGHRGDRRVASARARLSGLRTCAWSENSSSAGCSAPTPGTQLLGQYLGCDVKVSVARRSTFSAQLLYQGQMLYSYRARLRRGTRRRYISYTAAPFDMPGGTYTCRFAVGSNAVSTSFESGGPRGPVQAPYVCRPRDTVYGLCPTDQSATAFAAGQNLSCSAVFAGQKGKRVTWQVLFHQGSEWTLVQGGDYPARSPIEPMGFNFPVFGPDPAQYRPAGDYACRFLIDGQVAAEARFSVAG
jgi:hypothetical protein